MGKCKSKWFVKLSYEPNTVACIEDGYLFIYLIIIQFNDRREGGDGN